MYRIHLVRVFAWLPIAMGCAAGIPANGSDGSAAGGCGADCPGCGNGRLDPGETCDPGIAAGQAGACPAGCDDQNVCTADLLVNAGTCAASCTYTPITACSSGDGCCPPGCTPVNDSDCQPRCGNGMVEAGEQCDDGNTVSGDGCSASCQFEQVAFRITEILLRDPHAWVDACAILPCEDATDTTALFGPSMSVNGQIATAIKSDTTPQDGYFDLSALLIFGGLSANAASVPMQVIAQGDCAAQGDIACRPHVGAPILPTAARNQPSGPCLGVLDNTVLPYSPAISVPSGPCFLSDGVDGQLPVGNVFGSPMPLHDVRFAATFSGTPVSSLINGEMRGYIRESEADGTRIKNFCVDAPLSQAFSGGARNCHAAGPTMGDRDMVPDGAGGMTTGWYFYLNFTATRVPFTP